MTQHSHSPPPIALRRVRRAERMSPAPESLVAGRSSRVTRSAFSLVEILVTITLLSVIVLGLLAMFNQTQRAFRSSMTQTDVLEGGRAVMDLLTRELEQMTPYPLNTTNTTSINFYAHYIPLDVPADPLIQELPGCDPVLGPRRTNVLQEFFFLTRDNQTWSGIGYLVRPPDLGAGTLYRYVTNAHDSRPDLITRLSGSFLNAPPADFHRVADGIVHLRLRAFATDGTLIDPSWGVKNTTNQWDIVPGEIKYWFYGNAVPAYVEVELGILESQVLERFQGMINSPQIARAFLEKQAGKVHLFRRRVPIRSVDPAVYQ